MVVDVINFKREKMEVLVFGDKINCKWNGNKMLRLKCKCMEIMKPWLYYLNISFIILYQTMNYKLSHIMLFTNLLLVKVIRPSFERINWNPLCYFIMNFEIYIFFKIYHIQFRQDKHKNIDNLFIFAAAGAFLIKSPNPTHFLKLIIFFLCYQTEDYKLCYVSKIYIN